MSAGAIKFLAEFCDGDARKALNGLQLVLQAKKTTLSSSKEQQENEAQDMTPSQSDGGLKLAGGREDLVAESSAVEGGEVKKVIVTVEDVKESLRQRTHLLYDRAGDEHFNTISALIKSMRGSDANAALYWLSRMLCGGEDPLYIARRVVVFASEDIGQSLMVYDWCSLSRHLSCFSLKDWKTQMPSRRLLPPSMLANLWACQSAR